MMALSVAVRGDEKKILFSIIQASKTYKIAWEPEFPTKIAFELEG